MAKEEMNLYKRCANIFKANSEETNLYKRCINIFKAPGKTLGAFRYICKYFSFSRNLQSLL